MLWNTQDSSNNGMLTIVIWIEAAAAAPTLELLVMALSERQRGDWQDSKEGPWRYSGTQSGHAPNPHDNDADGI